MGEAGRQGQRERTGKKTLEKGAAISAQPQIESSAIRRQETLQKDPADQEAHPRPGSLSSEGPKLPTPCLNWEK